MDFSWVKDLADRANLQEQLRQETDRKRKFKEKQVALATGPFVEKLYLFFATCADEFNKHIGYNNLKVVTTRTQKRTKATANAGDPELSYAEEAYYFTFARSDWTYGIRGSKGLVEFLELPTPQGPGQLGYRLDEAAVTPTHKLTAHLDEGTQQIVWQRDGEIVDASAIIALCKEYFRDFIERTNPQSDQSRQ